MRVLANGVFDVFHVGHLLHLQAAAAMGDWLVVSVTRNEHVNKGPTRPMFDQEHRAMILRGLRCVDEVIFSDNALEALEIVKPDIFVKGSDYRGKIDVNHLTYCEEHGIRIAFTDEPLFSSTKIIHDRLRSR